MEQKTFIEKWKKVILYYFEENMITEETRKCLFSFLDAPGISGILDNERMPCIEERSMKEAVQNDLSMLLEMYKTKDIPDEITSEEYIQMTERIKNRWGVNVKKYEDITVQAL